MSVSIEEAQPAARVVVIVGQGGIQTDLDLDTLGDDEVADVIPDLLADYSAECRDWTLIAGEHWRRSRWSRAEDLLQKGIHFFTGGVGRPTDHMALVNLHAMLAHLHLALSRTAPKVSLPHAKYDKLPSNVKVKEDHFTEAAANLNKADQALMASGAGPDDEPIAVPMGKIILYLARGQPGTAQPMVERLLRRQPNNLVALTAHARLQFARRAHEQALQTYQKLLSLDPEMRPDPRIGIGLCLWMLGDKQKARLAWERALQRDPSSWTCMLLTGFAALNTAREPATAEDDRAQLIAEGVAYVQSAFKLNNKNAAAALTLASVSGQNGQTAVASKLAERAIQYADNKRHAVLANTERGRMGFIMQDLVDATPFLTAARQDDGGVPNILADLTLAQIAIQGGNLREALNFMDGLTPRLVGKGPMEYVVMHASLLAYPHPGMSSAELASNRSKARAMLTELHSVIQSAETDEDMAKVRHIADDTDVFLDLAKMWQKESLEKAIGAYQTAVSGRVETIVDEGGEVEVDQRAVKMSSNLGALYQLQGNADTAERMYQEALQRLGNEAGKEAEEMRTILAFNLGRAYEEAGETTKASQWYRDVLRQHPEHMESKVRLACIAAAAGRNFDAHTLLKECLKSDESNITLRSTYTHFLISLGSLKEALAFTSQTLKLERADVFTYCALGWIHFTLGREAKSTSELAERTKQYLRSAEAYERALTLDPACAMAAQGLAIALAEDTLALKPLGAAVGTAEEMKARMRLAGQALGVFSRIADSIQEGSVHVNIGHSFFVRGEEDKAIQSYEAADNHHKGRNVPVLLYLARAWYAYANRESNFSAMSKALSFCQRAMHIQPNDRAILYNIAMIQQKAAEMLFGLEPSKRTLEELHVALRQAQQAANTFRALAEDRGALPYDPDLADQRARYGDTLLRRAPDQLSRQESFEAEAQARVQEARRIRAEEQARIQAAEAARRAEIEAKAAELAEQRRKEREEAHAWQEEMNVREMEERAKKAAAADKKKRKKDNGDSGDEGLGGKKRKGKKGRKVRSKSEILSDEEDLVYENRDNMEVDQAGSEVEEEDSKDKARGALEALRAKRKKKVEEEPRRGKSFKSKEYIEDSEDEEEGDEERKGSVSINGVTEGEQDENEEGDGGETDLGDPMGDVELGELAQAVVKAGEED
ncbi:RNA polymerase-associated protein CTR9 [Tremella mesenterica]|uniref:RNA polymerase-associated protein CTR9 n=1 Tax=Tremella mesenterica TaxID=5217 RepID=A0A4Q1BPW4_TREME|nr:RNA polymerase-associated protein CTR9 [Tremella mesenterica]